MPIRAKFVLAHSATYGFFTALVVFPVFLCSGYGVAYCAFLVSLATLINATVAWWLFSFDEDDRLEIGVLAGDLSLTLGYVLTPMVLRTGMASWPSDPGLMAVAMTAMIPATLAWWTSGTVLNLWLFER